MTQVPANVTIPGLPLGTTTNVGASLIEAVQTAAGQANSVQLTLSQVVSGILGIPVAVASGGTGTTALTAFGVVFGGTSAVGVTAAGTTAWPLVGNGSALAPSFAVLSVSGGGINTTTLTQNGIVFGNGTSTVGITGAGNTALVLLSPGPLTSPVFGQISLTAAVTGVLGVPNGGQGTSTLTQNGVVFGNGTSTVGITVAGATALPLVSPGPLANPSYSILTVPGGGTGTTILTANSVLLGAGSSILQFATPGTSGNLLISQNATTNPVFVAAVGDVTISASGTTTIAANAVTLTKMAQGTGLSVLALNSTTLTGISVISANAANQVLGVNAGGTALVFAVPAMVLLNTLSPSGVATTGDTTSMTSTFRDYMITFENVVPVNSTAIFQIQVATTGTAFVSGNYVSFASTMVPAGFAGDTNTSVIQVSGSRATTTVGNGTTYGVNGFAKIFNPAGTTMRKTVVGEVSYLTGTTSNTTFLMIVPFSGYQDVTNAITGIQFSFSPGNIQTGTIKIYGLS